MDPTVATERIIRAIIDRDPEELRLAAADLADWLEKGGFSPACGLTYDADRLTFDMLVPLC
jgi:hypothetical protein